MERPIAICMLAICLFLCLGADSAQDWASIRQAGENINTISAEFIQTKNLEILKEPLLSRGRFFYQAPDSIRWEYISPIRTLTLMQGDKLQRFVWSQNSWRSDANPSAQAMQAVLGKMQLWLQGKFQGGSEFTATLLDGPNTLIQLKAGEAMRAYVEEIVMTLGHKPGVIKRIDIKEYGRSSTSIEFHDLKLNMPIDSKVFSEP